MNFYKHHIGDYDADTSHLSWDEDMAYTRMIRTYYRREKPLPEDVKEVCRLVRATSRVQREAVQAVLGEFFSLEADGWHQKRCDGELAEANRKAEQNRTVGKLGGRPRKTQNPEETQTVSEQKPTNNPNGFDPVSRNNPSQTPDSRLQTPDLPEAQQQAPTGIGAGQPASVASPVSRSIEIAVYLRQRGIVGANSANPNIAAWGDDARVTNEILDAALSIVGSRQLAKPVGPNYLVGIIADLLNPKPSQQKRDDHAWKRSDKAVEAKASELGIYARPGESHDALRERCEAEIRRRAQGGAA
ncbi:YdaU family protein [Burkholderia pseudomallei]|uniref:YdaU family protein n=1 Tax=Burkholderia pseudomallei TaxID=28450 RepID=UPI000CDCE574|nr:YdaU family protein [Burkholderia pseudomallei]